MSKWGKMSNDEGASVRRSFLDKILDLFMCFPRGSSPKVVSSSSPQVKSPLVKKQASRSKESGSNEATSSGKPTAEVPSLRESTAAVLRQLEQQIQLEQRIQEQQQKKLIINPPAKGKIANYEPTQPHLRRGGSVASYRNNSTGIKRNNSTSHSVPASGELSYKKSPSTTMKRMNSTSQSVPASGEIAKGGPSLTKSASKGMSKLRDTYVNAMIKLGDLSNSVNLGTSVNLSDSQAFESEGFRKRTQAEQEIMELYLQTSIQPSEWKDAQMGSRIKRNSSVRV